MSFCTVSSDRMEWEREEERRMLGWGEEGKGEGSEEGGGREGW